MIETYNDYDQELPLDKKAVVMLEEDIVINTDTAPVGSPELRALALAGF